MHTLNKMVIAQTTKPHKKRLTSPPTTTKGAYNPEKGANYFPTPKRGLATPPNIKKGTKSPRPPTPKYLSQAHKHKRG